MDSFKKCLDHSRCWFRNVVHDRIHAKEQVANVFLRIDAKCSILVAFFAFELELRQHSTCIFGNEFSSGWILAFLNVL